LQKKPASHADVKNPIFIEPGKATTTGTIRHMIARLPGIKIAIGIPTEEDRVQSDPQEVEAYFEPLQSILIGSAEEMVVNLDATGHCDWADA
jgi:spore germination protein YaaH